MQRQSLRYLWLVQKIAHQISRKLPPKAPVDYDDLVAVGWLGLLQAMAKHRPHETRLETFAGYRIRGAMLDELRRLDPISRCMRRRQKAGQTVPETHSLDAPDVYGDVREFDDPRPGGEPSIDMLDVVRLLEAREREIVFRYYWEAKTMKSIGQELGLSESRVSQLLSRALKRLRLRPDLCED